MTGNEHVPLIEVDDSHFTSTCSCGWANPYFWGGIEGARAVWIGHVLTETVPQEWHPRIGDLLSFVEVPQ